MSARSTERVGARALLLGLALAVAWPAGAAGERDGWRDRAGASVPADEADLADAIAALRAGDLDGAIARLEPLVARNPGFRLAQLVYADALSARHRGLGRFGDRPAGTGLRLDALRDEARLRVNHADGPPPGSVPSNVLMISDSQPEVIVVDLAAGRLYVVEPSDFGPDLVRHVYVTIGKNGAGKRREGDQRTPEGVYFITGRIDPEALPDFYGTGALPVDYPNEWDRRLGRTGFGIWIHGVPRQTYARAPRASDGCLVVSNDHLDTLWGTLDGRATPVIMADSLTWEPAAVVADRAAGLARAIDRWRRDWESLDPGLYARHYAPEFRSESSGRERWLARKREVNATKRWVQVDVSDLSAFAYPGEDDLVVVTFDQHYRSDNYRGTSRKRQYWSRDGRGAWRIVYEGEVKLRPEHLRGIPFSARSEMAELLAD